MGLTITWDLYLSERYDGIRAADGHRHGDA